MHTADQTATAYHEVGHSGVALALGQPVHRVSMVPTQERAGERQAGRLRCGLVSGRATRHFFEQSGGAC